MSTNAFSLMDITQPALPATVNPVVRYQQVEFDKRAMNALLRKIDLRVMPLVILVYFFSFLDENNIGHARRVGLIDDLSLSKLQYKWAVWIYYIAYVLCTLPVTLLMRRFSLSKWIAILMFTWGITTIFMMLVYNLAGLLVARFFLGMAESGAISGVYFYLSLWYIRKDQAFRMGIFVSGAALAGAFDGIIAYGITQIDARGSLIKWQWLFLAEGVPTVFLAIVMYKLLADPATVKWLDQCEKDILTARLLSDVQVSDDDNNEPLCHQARSVCLDWKVWFYVFIYLGEATAYYGVNSLLPIIIGDMCHTNATNATNATDATTELLTVPLYLAACLTMIISSWNASRLNERSNHIMILLLIEIGGYLYLILAEKYLYIGAMIVGIGMFSSGALTLSWMINNIGGRTNRAIVIALAVGSGNILPILGEQIYREPDKALYNRGHWIVIATVCFTFILVLSLKLLLRYENRRRTNSETVPLHVKTVAGKKPILLKMHPNFVYVT